MADEVILAIDAGTTGVTALLIDHVGVVRAHGYRELTQHYPRPGWVEHDALEIWRAVQAASGEALAAASGLVPIALGVANQRETLLSWDRRSGAPLHRAIVWQCRRSEPICEELRRAGLEREVRRTTGLRLDPYFSGTKALWLRRNDASLAARIDAGDVCFGTIDSWLAWQLSGAALHVTDYTNASRTLAFNIDRLDWDDGLMQVFGLDRRVMPEVGPSGAVRGETVATAGIPAGLPIAALVGDQQAALHGQACFAPGLTKATFGTGCFILMNTGATRIDSDAGLITTLTARTARGTPEYALEGSIFVAGAAVQWCRDNLGLVVSAEAAEALASEVEDAGGAVFVPAFAGLGSPHWGPEVRGAVFGLTGATQKAHILRAAIDSMVFQAQDVLDVMRKDTSFEISEVRADGGAAANPRLMQLQADLAGAAVSLPRSVESTALGAAYLAGLAVGFWRDEAEIASLRREAGRLTPSRRAASARAEHARWQAAVRGLLRTDLKP